MDGDYGCVLHFECDDDGVSLPNTAHGWMGTVKVYRRHREESVSDGRPLSAILVCPKSERFTCTLTGYEAL